MQSRKAYTLMELILVMTLIVIMGAITVPSIMDTYGHYCLRAAVDDVRAGWVGARSHAIEEGQRYRFAVVPGKGNFRIAPDSPEFWGGTLPDFDRDNPPLVIEDSLPVGIRFSINKQDLGLTEGGDSSLPHGSVDPGQWVGTAYFEADGTAQEDVEISFNSTGNRSIILSVRALTGITSVKMAPVAGQR